MKLSARFYQKLLIANLLSVILLLHPMIYLLLPNSYAGLMTNAKLVINNSQSGASNVTYSFYFTTTATTSIKQIGIQICDAASGTCNVPSGFNPGSPTLASDNIAGSGRTTTDPNASGERFRIVVGTPSTQSTQTMGITFTGVTNPSTNDTTSYARITTYSDTGSTEIDSVTVAFAVLTSSSIAVSATIDPSLTFSVAAVNSGTVNGSSIDTDLSATASTIPFGTLTAATPKILAHDLTVSTNASNGYKITASHTATITGNPPLTSGATNNIDTFSGTNTSPATWSSPGGSTPNTNTGFFGYTTEDTTLCETGANRFDSNKWAGTTITGSEVACSSAGVSSETTRVGWEIEVNSIQPAGSYTGTVILIATPTY